MLKVGLTGNIGSGKTTVAKIFEALGAKVFHADEEAKRILNEEPQRTILITRFGQQVINPENEIDRKVLAGLIFNNKEALDFVNHLIHPLVRKRLKLFCKSNKNIGLCLYEAAVLIETGFYKKLDKVILITAPEELRIQRVMERDGASRELVLQRVRNQWEESRKARFADFVIVNDNKIPLLDQCLAVFNVLKSARPALKK